VQVSPLLFFRWSRWQLSVGSPGFYVLDSVLKSVTGVELLKEVFTSKMRWMLLIIEWNASTNMFYLLKHLLLLIYVIFKLKCNNLSFNKIMMLNVWYVCLHVFLLRRVSFDPDPERRTLHFWGGSVTLAHPPSTMQTTTLGHKPSWSPLTRPSKYGAKIHHTLNLYRVFHSHSVLLADVELNY
jgi:hypothetical protein